MLRFFLFCFVSVCLFFLKETDGQTYAGVPDSSHVLVVHNELDLTSVKVKNYYQTARSIPEVNIVPLYLPDTIITINGITHTVGIAQQTDLILDIDQDINSIA